MKMKQNKTIVNAISVLRSDIREYSYLFSQYRQQLMGYDFCTPYQEATDNPVQADKSLIEMNNCLYSIVSNTLKVKQVLSLNDEYPPEQIKEANENLVDLAGTSDFVHRRIRQLSNPDKSLIGIHNIFMENLTILKTSIIEFNKNRTNTLYSFQQALEVYNEFQICLWDNYVINKGEKHER
jgi:hypothetical protein